MFQAIPGTVARVSILLTAVAVRMPDVDVVVRATASWFDAFGVTLETSARSSRWSEMDFFGADERGWTVVIPPYDVASDQLGLGISKAGLITSAVSIYEDVLWTHVLCENGEVVDRFVNIPDYFGDDDDPGPTWRGNGAAVGSALGADAALIAPYFRQFRALENPQGGTRAHDDDEWDLLDGWVIVDLWRRIGITYPDPAAALIRRWIEPGYASRLPGGPV
jgi:hypothetical protein